MSRERTWSTPFTGRDVYPLPPALCLHRQWGGGWGMAGWFWDMQVGRGRGELWPTSWKSRKSCLTSPKGDFTFPKCKNVCGVLLPRRLDLFWQMKWPGCTCPGCPGRPWLAVWPAVDTASCPPLLPVLLLFPRAVWPTVLLLGSAFFLRSQSVCSVSVSLGRFCPCFTTWETEPPDKSSLKKSLSPWGGKQPDLFLSFFFFFIPGKDEEAWMSFASSFIPNKWFFKAFLNEGLFSYSYIICTELVWGRTHECHMSAAPPSCGARGPRSKQTVLQGACDTGTLEPTSASPLLGWPWASDSALSEPQFPMAKMAITVVSAF